MQSTRIQLESSIKKMAHTKNWNRMTTEQHQALGNKDSYHQNRLELEQIRQALRV